LTDDMPRNRPVYIRHEKSRHGTWTWAFRRGKEYVRLPDTYGTPEFWDAYRLALAGEKPKPRPVDDKRSLAWLVARYKESARFSSYKPSTRRLRDNILTSVCKTQGEKPFAKIERKHIQGATDAKRASPHAANNALIVLSQMFQWAVKSGHMEKNPCEGVDTFKVVSTGFHAWTVEEVEQFRAHHAVGTKARLAIDLLLFLGLRRSDVIRAGRQHVRDGVLQLSTTKTNTTVHLTICDELDTSIKATKTGDLAFLTSATGRPFASGQSFGNWFKERCREAGLPKRCAAHGLRKAGATIAAERGATARQLMAMYGWSRIEMAELYTKEADKLALARGASERIANSFVTDPKQGSGFGPEKIVKSTA